MALLRIRNRDLKFIWHNTNILFLKFKLPIEMTELVSGKPFMEVKSKWQIASQAKWGCSEKLKIFKIFLCSTNNTI